MIVLDTDTLSLLFVGDLLAANWVRHGKIVSMGYSYRSELWRLTPQK